MDIQFGPSEEKCIWPLCNDVRKNVMGYLCEKHSAIHSSGHCATEEKIQILQYLKNTPQYKHMQEKVEEWIEDCTSYSRPHKECPTCGHISPRK